VTSLNSDNFDEYLKKENMLAVFYANWCPLCLILLDRFEFFEKNYQEKIKLIDFDINKELARRYNVTGVPTVIAIKDQNIADVRPGFREDGQYIEMINMLQ
jgi:thioredoxin 1